MDLHTKDVPERPSQVKRQTERDLTKRHSAGWQEQAQRRYSLVQGTTIRGLPSGWEDPTVVRNGSGVSEVGSAPSAPSALLSRQPIMTEIKSLDVPKMTAIKSLETFSPEELALDTGVSPRSRYTRSRTKTMEERPRLPPSQAFTVKSADPNLTKGMKFTTAPVQGVTVVDPSVMPPARTTTRPPPTGPESRRLRRTRQRSVNMPVGATQAADASIIKVGRLLCWGTGVATSLHSPRPKGRSSSRRVKTGPDVWQGISAVLRENGELKLFDAAEVSLVAVIRLSQLSRRAIQQLHASVLDDRFCIAIYPRHAIGAAAMSSARPLYLALESRVQFETWWALLRAFAMPELYGPDQTAIQELLEADLSTNSRRPVTRDIFRLERSIFLRVIEAKIRPVRPRTVPEKRSGHPPAISAKEDPREKYFSEILMDGVTRARTVHRDGTENLFWRDDFDFSELPRSSSALTVVLKKEIPTSATGKAALEDPASLAREGPGITVCGQLELDFDTACHNNDVEVWRPLLDPERQNVGDVLIRAHAEELVVLMMHEYQPLSEVIHRFSTNVPAQITRAIPRRLHLLSEVFVNVFQVSGRVDEWLMVLAESEIDAAFTKTTSNNERSLSRIDSSERSDDNPGERELLTHELGKTVTTQVNLLFRGNSLLTRSIDLYMRRVGKEYLEETLRDVVLEINASEADCEVDPSRVQPPSTDLTKNWSSLVRCFRMVWTAIRESIVRCPREMRLLLRHIRTCCEERFGSYHHTVRYSSVSGFLFLRFFCPAVLNPKIFGLLPDHPRPLAQRTFTLVAKSLQGIANMSTFGNKERWMEPMNNHLVVHRQEFLSFIDTICAITADQLPLHLTPPSYTTPMTILSRLPPTHREGFPSLPYLIDEARNYAALVKIWLDADPDLSTIETTGDEDLAEFHEICLHLQRRAQDCVAKAEHQSDGLLSPGIKKTVPARPIVTRNETSTSLPPSTMTSVLPNPSQPTLEPHHVLDSHDDDPPPRTSYEPDPSGRSSTPLSRDGAKQAWSELMTGFWKKGK
ncbi:MAG: hypothetical protein M1823_002251 [Watsoniomyces obsoletus]|nr:MAG: hypothetical protein M1823_002251 [Watsoniomyces obsoletus]